MAAQEGEYLARLLNKQYDVSAVQNNVLLPPMWVDNITVSSPADRIAELSTKTNKFARPFQYLDL